MLLCVPEGYLLTLKIIKMGSDFLLIVFFTLSITRPRFTFFHPNDNYLELFPKEHLYILKGEQEFL